MYKWVETNHPNRRIQKQVLKLMMSAMPTHSRQDLMPISIRLSAVANKDCKGCSSPSALALSAHVVARLVMQAADLRYIMEAPKLEIGKDERVTIPLLQSDTWRAKE